MIDAPTRISIGVSSCLAGQPVRYDGADRRDNYVCDTLAHFFDLIPYCPEMAIGLGVPRTTIQLLERDDQIHLVDCNDNRVDHSSKMKDTASAYCSGLPSAVAGYIVKARSPSCGMQTVKVFNENGQSHTTGRGMFTARLMHMHPALPVEEEDRLYDPKIRENFIERVFVYAYWQALNPPGMEDRDALLRFHHSHKLTLLAHDESKYPALDAMVATCTADNLEQTAQDYILALMAVLKKPATTDSHLRVLSGIFEQLKADLDEPDISELGELLSSFSQGMIPLLAPLTLINHHLRRLNLTELNKQSYLSPHPSQQMLLYRA